MGTVEKVYDISGEVEVTFGRLMRYRFYCLGWISFFFPILISDEMSVVSSELTESEYSILIILMSHLV